MSILSIISNCSERLFSYHWNFTICLLVNFFIIIIPMDCGTLMSTKKDWYREGWKSCIIPNFLLICIIRFFSEIFMFKQIWFLLSWEKEDIHLEGHSPFDVYPEDTPSFWHMLCACVATQSKVPTHTNGIYTLKPYLFFGLWLLLCSGYAPSDPLFVDYRHSSPRYAYFYRSTEHLNV